jgi:hypothetical protein
MATRDLGRLAERVKAHRLALYPSRLAAARAAGVSKDTWQKVEEAMPDIREASYAKIDQALGWAIGSCTAIADGGEPVLVDHPDNAAPTPAPIDAETLRRAAFEAARAKLPAAPIGDVDAFSDELVDVLRKAGYVRDAE